jgi:sugar O-acyltransferase (sialic acid O-acetyltransferase NeuD family)
VKAIPMNKESEFTERPICIIGAGGFGREILCILYDLYKVNNWDLTGKVCFAVNRVYFNAPFILGFPVIIIEDSDLSVYNVVISNGDPIIRKKIFNTLPFETNFITIIHPQAIISPWVTIGRGSVICAGCVITCDIEIGEHSQLNLHSTVGHDTRIDSFFTSAPGVNISGNCAIGSCVYIGTNASIKAGISIVNNSIIGMGASVIRSITEAGTYGGVPAKQIEKH